MLFSPVFANNPPPSPPASPALANAHQGKARALLPPPAVSTRPRTPRFKHDENWPTPCHSKCDHCPHVNPPSQTQPSDYD
ncbi:hypothetical protein K443DRAFT_659522 [Laccaria amethystina LaAM-08-1]|uniref:Uncharacterized protein n=1 Tax=Laccaria amethystina LaAM-08-1 TaxID=1095629 RepID=A0A0C9XKT6_9AGAR|nr:hypothetical protein K443DRAFT_659522 [Laccaria amethystina LaAM-08-1]